MYVVEISHLRLYYYGLPCLLLWAASRLATWPNWWSESGGGGVDKSLTHSLTHNPVSGWVRGPTTHQMPFIHIIHSFIHYYLPMRLCVVSTLPYYGPSHHAAVTHPNTTSHTHFHKSWMMVLFSTPTSYWKQLRLFNWELSRSQGKAVKLIEARHQGN